MTVLRTFDRTRGHMLLGLAGAAGAGKDTCAQLLVTSGFVQLAFADALRDEVAEAWRVDLAMLVDRGTKEWPIPALATGNCLDARFVHRMLELGYSPTEPRSARWVMQRWGTDYRRALDGDAYWIDHALQRLMRLRGQGHARVVITDVRFDNEVQAVRALGGACVQVLRPDTIALQADTARHGSARLPAGLEAEAIHNDGGLQHLEAELARVLHALGWNPWERVA